jgi:hypothetical protein
MLDESDLRAIPGELNACAVHPQRNSAQVDLALTISPPTGRKNCQCLLVFPPLSLSLSLSLRPRQMMECVLLPRDDVLLFPESQCNDDERSQRFKDRQQFLSGIPSRRRSIVPAVATCQPPPSRHRGFLISCARS